MGMVGLDSVVEVAYPRKDGDFLPMLPSSTKTSLDTQIECGKCLGYQPLKDLEMEM